MVLEDSLGFGTIGRLSSGSRGTFRTAAMPFLEPRATFDTVRMPPILAEDSYRRPQILFSLARSPFCACHKPLPQRSRHF